MLGGIIGPITEELAVTATEKSSSYPSLTMAGIRAPPIAEVSATAEPDTAGEKHGGHNIGVGQASGHPAMTTRHSSRMSSMMPTGTSAHPPE